MLQINTEKFSEIFTAIVKISSDISDYNRALMEALDYIKSTAKQDIIKDSAISRTHRHCMQWNTNLSRLLHERIDNALIEFAKAAIHVLTTFKTGSASTVMLEEEIHHILSLVNYQIDGLERFHKSMATYKLYLEKDYKAIRDTIAVHLQQRNQHEHAEHFYNEFAQLSEHINKLNIKESFKSFNRAVKYGNDKSDNTPNYLVLTETLLVRKSNSIQTLIDCAMELKIIWEDQKKQCIQFKKQLRVPDKNKIPIYLELPYIETARKDWKQIRQLIEHKNGT
ncbi:MAG: hypothetical protein ABUK01_18625 [Leptospirales bacterium]